MNNKGKFDIKGSGEAKLQYKKENLTGGNKKPFVSDFVYSLGSTKLAFD